jgi:hypothetical protein
MEYMYNGKLRTLGIIECLEHVIPSEAIIMCDIGIGRKSGSDEASLVA